jgi:hypothetical protein
MIFEKATGKLMDKLNIPSNIIKRPDVIRIIGLCMKARLNLPSVLLIYRQIPTMIRNIGINHIRYTSMKFLITSLLIPTNIAGVSFCSNLKIDVITVYTNNILSA